MKALSETVRIAIACGGTGGHLFPGVAVGTELAARGADVTLLVSPKDVDQQAVRGLRELTVQILPAVALQGGNVSEFVTASWRARAAAKRIFAPKPPHAVLAMGGFTAAPPILAGKSFGAVTALHESNTIPGRANRWLAHLVDECFVGFPEAAQRLWHPRVTHTGTPVRESFTGEINPAGARTLLGLKPHAPTLVIMGGSQGARGVNQQVTAALPALVQRIPGLQFLHLTGEPDFETVRTAYQALAQGPTPTHAVVRPFLSEMEFVLAAATLVVSRSGASSLAEFAARGTPAVLIPLPTSQDNHQFHNAAALVHTGAARMLEQLRTHPAEFAEVVGNLLLDEGARQSLSEQIGRWHVADAPQRIANRLAALLAEQHPKAPALLPAPEPIL